MTSPTSPSVVSRFVVVALAVPTAITVAGLALQAAWLDSIPHPAAVHWWPSDTPDGFGSGWTFLAITAGLGLGLPLLIALTTLPMLRRGARGATFRFMAAFALGMSAFMVTLNTASVAVQRGLANAADAPGVLPWVLASLGIGAASGLAGWFLQPHQHTEIPDWDAAAHLDLGPDERVVWMRTVTIARPGVLLLGGMCLAVAFAAITAWIAGELTAAWILLGTLAVLTFSASIATVFHIRIDDDGLTAVAAPGFPRLRVPLADVSSVGVAPVNGFAEFGGYGLRTRPGATGVILRNGEALRVDRKKGRSVVITVDDAHTAAAVLTALAARASSRGEA